MSASLDYDIIGSCIVFNPKGKTHPHIATAEYDGSDYFILDIEPEMKLPPGILSTIGPINRETCNWIALAVAEYNEL